MNKDDMELFGKMKLGLPIQKRDFIMILMDSSGFNPKMIPNRTESFLNGKIKHYGYFKMKDVPKYRLAWASTNYLNDESVRDGGEHEVKIVKDIVLKELKYYLDLAKKMVEPDKDEDFDYEEVQHRGEWYFYSKTLKDSILLSIFNLDPEKAAVKKYSSVKTADDFFKLLEKMTLKASKNSWSDGMLFTDEFKLIINQVKKYSEYNSYTEK